MVFVGFFFFFYVVLFVVGLLVLAGTRNSSMGLNVGDITILRKCQCIMFNVSV